MINIAFLFSGSGSLISSVIDLCNTENSNCSLKLIISNNKKVSSNNIDCPDDAEFHVLDHFNYHSRREHEDAIEKLLVKHKIDLIVLGGYRRIFTAEFVSKFGTMTINTHPSILPSFPGDKAQKSAIEYGVRCSGATVHFINNEVDQGPIIAQSVIEVKIGVTESELRRKITETEKHLIPLAIRLIASEKIEYDGEKIIYKSNISESLLYVDLS
ncbi:phosphoribosylglycinamide formyltransferase [Vibrio caribbeanicus]|uniref:phosphoribosylglycinamide formyltransferase n=1 Tax=Vibrio caribbeanicus TaxID=701175 RepID=UPI002283A600|nr:phosphoribosylglycinamide formyltransferase [Vibrio caribbeanicus]MCY9845814.1 phosphoribosylglycinamide formyltransferase [Vibrio caribbeanicus]